MPLLTGRSLAVVPPASATGSREKVLFAMCDTERTQFFPIFPGNFLESAPYGWEDPGNWESYHAWVEYLKEFRPTVLVSCWSTPQIPVELLFSETFPLRYVCHVAGSVKHLVPRRFIENGGFVTNWGSIVSHAVAEHALLLVLASLRNLPKWHSRIHQDRYLWGNSFAFKTRTLRGKKVGIHGFGNIARELIRLLQPFEVDCAVFSENVPSLHIEKSGATACHDLHELFRTSDILIECEALTKRTTRMVTEEHFRLMPQDATFVNVARGAIVDEQALNRVAQSGHIRIASDVFEEEPLPIHSPLRNRENVIVSPHIGGPTGECYIRCGTFVLENLGRYLKGQTLENIVDLKIYDRST